MSLVSPGGSRLPRLKGSVPGANPFLPGPVDRVLSEGQCRAGSGPDAKLAPGRAAGQREVGHPDTPPRATSTRGRITLTPVLGPSPVTMGPDPAARRIPP